MYASSTSSFDEVLDRKTSMKHDLFIDVLELTEKIPLYCAKVSDDEAFGNVMGIEQFG